MPLAQPMVEIVLLIGYLMSVRFRFRDHNSTTDTRPDDEHREDYSSSRRTSSEKSTLAGVPLRILLSERSAPGELLRDTLLTRPSPRDSH